VQWFGADPFSFSSKDTTTHQATGAYTVKIPTFLVDSEHSKVLETAIKRGEHVVMSAKIELPKHDGTFVDYSLWYSSVYDLSLQLIVDLYEYEASLGEKVRFTPRLITFNCTDCPKDIKKRDCYSSG
jgi:hypothetical protein